MQNVQDAILCRTFWLQWYLKYLNVSVRVLTRVSALSTVPVTVSEDECAPVKPLHCQLYICRWQEIPCLTLVTPCFLRARLVAGMSVVTCIYVSHINVCSSSRCPSRRFCSLSCCRSGKYRGLGLSHSAWCCDLVQNFDVRWSAFIVSVLALSYVF